MRNENVIHFPSTSKARSAIRSTQAEIISLSARSTPLAAAGGLTLAECEALPKEEKRLLAALIEESIEVRLSDRSASARPVGLEQQRASRYAAWGKAAAAACFWKALADLDHALLVAQREKVSEALLYDRVEAGSAGWHATHRAYQDATDGQLLTPAPNMGCVRWKQRQRFSRLPREAIEKAIADDLAWLEKFPACERRIRRPVD